MAGVCVGVVVEGVGVLVTRLEGVGGAPEASLPGSVAFNPATVGPELSGEDDEGSLRAGGGGGVS